MKKIISIVIIGLLTGCSFGVQGLFFEKTAEESATTDLGDFFFDKKIELFMTLAKFPSLSACIINGDEVTWSNEYGFYDLENKKSATENTIYNMGSISKTITGTALMQLWEQGLFDLDEDVNNYLPFSLRNSNFPDDPITFRMLLTHSSSLNTESGQAGLIYSWTNFSADPPFEGYPYPWLEEHLTPGGKWYYSGRWSSTYRPGDFNMYAKVNPFLNIVKIIFLNLWRCILLVLISQSLILIMLRFLIIIIMANTYISMSYRIFLEIIILPLVNTGECICILLVVCTQRFLIFHIS